MENLTDILSSHINLLIYISTAIIFLLIFRTIFLHSKLHAINNELKSIQVQNKSLNTLYDGVRGFKHDFDNIIDVIGGYIKLNDIEGLRNYYDELKSDCISANSIQLLSPNVINNPGIYNLITSEYQKASNLGIKVHLEIFFDFSDLHMPIYEFSKILGILINNSIEAANDSAEKEINLLFRDSSKNNVKILTIENTYTNKDIDTAKIFEKGISSKENHTGLGLWEIKKIIDKNNNVILHTTKDNNLFKQQLEIYY